MKLNSTLSRVVAQQMGTMQGRLSVYASTSLNNILKSFENGCPTNSEIQRIIAVVSNVEKILTNYKRQIVKYNSIVTRLDVVIRTVTTSVNILRFIPIPTAVAGVGVPIGLTNRFSKSLIDISDFLDSLNEDRNAVVLILRGSNIDTTRIQSTINNIKQRVESCVTTNQTGDDQSALTTGQRVSNDNLNVSQLVTLEDGRQYNIEIITVQNSELNIPKRFAQAKDRNGVVIIKGETSYSSDETILIEEVLFRLENL